MPDAPKPPRPPPPAPETLQGIGSGIREILVKVDKLGQGHEALSEAVGRVEYKQNEQSFQIEAIKRAQDLMKVELTDHGDRIIELERLPFARAPYPSHPQFVEEDDDHLEETHPGGHFRVPRHKVAAMERTLSHLREQVDASDRAREIEKAAREAVEKDRAAMEEKATADIKKWILRAKLIAAIGAPAAAVIAWVLIHIFHL